MPETSFAAIIRESGLVSGGDRGVVMVSGGADSVALLNGLSEVLGADSLVALHVNYGLRDESVQDEQLVRRHCDRLGVELVIRRAGPPRGNTQAWARAERYESAEAIRSERDLDWIAVGHNRSDQVETFIYRLAASPGVRSLLAMPSRSGRVIRPLLGVSGSLLRERARDLGLEFAEDASNRDQRYARNRIRHEVIPSLERVSPAAALNIARTREELAEDDEALTAAAIAAIEALGPEGAERLPAEELAKQHPAVRRRMLRQLAETRLGRPVAVPMILAAEVTRLASDPEGGRLDLGGGASFLVEAGRVGVLTSDEEIDVPGPLRIGIATGSFVFGEWEIESSRTTEELARKAFGDPWTAFLDLEGTMPVLRSWQKGDRVEPLGMTGSKKLQDVFTDALVPASRRGAWPVLVAGETVIWVPGLVRSKHRLIGGPDKPVLHLQATPPRGYPTIIKPLD